MIKDAEVGLNISETIPCSMLDKVFIVMGEVDIGLRTALRRPIIWVI